MATNYNKKFYKDYEELQSKYDKQSLENKRLLLRATIAEDEQARLQHIVDKQELKENELRHELKELVAENQELKKELERLKVIQNNDGTNSEIPTSQTPINKKKVIPNFAKNTGGKIGRKQGHKKDKLEKLPDEEINIHKEHILKSCPNCECKELIKTGNIISKDEIDYNIIVVKRRHEYIEYRCSCCGKNVHEKIPNHLKEECQYGSNVKTLALSLTNIGNVPFNKTRRILSGLSIDEINPCEGYLVKLQKIASKGLENFVEELRQYAINSSLLYWDDTVIMVDTKQACMRYYGNEDFCLFKAHEKKNKEGLDKDNILKLLSKYTVVEHNHNKVNYNSDYSLLMLSVASIF